MDSHLVPKPLFLEDFKKYRALAGLLTCPRFEPPSHIFRCSGYEVCQNVALGLTVAGLFRIFT
jgi:hypothetical protein